MSWNKWKEEDLTGAEEHGGKSRSRRLAGILSRQTFKETGDEHEKRGAVKHGVN